MLTEGINKIFKKNLRRRILIFIIKIIERFPQVIECQESKKIQQKLHWRSHQFNTSEDDLVMIGHQQSLQHLQTIQYQDLKPSLSPKSSSNAIKGSLQQQQEKLKKIVNLQNSSANTQLQNMLNSQANTSGIGKLNPPSNSNNNMMNNQINQMSKSSSSSVLPPSKNPIMAQNPQNVNRSAHIKANNMLHLSNSIDYDCSSSYINPFNYISIKGGPQSTTSLIKGQNQSVTNISNQQIAKQLNNSSSNQRKTPQNINNNSINHPISSQILTSTSQNSNSSKTPNFFVSPKVKKRQSATATVSQPVSVQSSAHKSTLAKRVLQQQQLQSNTELQQKISTNNSQIVNGNKTTNASNSSISKLQSHLNQNITLPQGENQINQNNSGVNNMNHNNSSSNLFVQSPNSNYQQYQILNQKNKKQKEASSNNNTAVLSIAKKKKKKTEVSKNSCLLPSPQSTSYLASNVNNSTKNISTMNNNNTNNSKLHNNSQITQEEEYPKKEPLINVFKSPTFHNQSPNVIPNPLQNGDQNKVRNKEKNKNKTDIAEKERVLSEKGRINKEMEIIVPIATISSIQENPQNSVSRNYLENHQDDNQGESKQVSRQSEKSPQLETDDLRNNIEKKKKKSRKKSPLNKEINQKSKSPSQSRSQKRKQRSSQKRKHLKTSQSPSRSQNKSYSTHLQVSTDNFQQIQKSLKSKNKLNNIRSSDNLESHSQNQNYVSSDEASKTQQNSLDKSKSQQQSIENSLRANNQKEKLLHAQELIKQNLQKQKLQKMIQQQKQKQELEERQRKSQYLSEINDQIRQLNSQKSPKRDQNYQPFSQMNSAITQQNTNTNAFSPLQFDHRIPWGANQQKLNGIYLSNAQKMHKNQKSEHDQYSNSSMAQLAQMQKKEQQERERRERLGLGFLNDKNDSFVEQIVQKSKEKIKQINGSTSDFEQEMKTKKKHLLDAQRLSEIHKYMMYKKSIYEQNNLMKNQEKISKVVKIKENKCLLESNIRQILKRLKYSTNKSIKNKPNYPQYKFQNPHYFSQFTESNKAIGSLPHYTSSDSFHQQQHHLTSQNNPNQEILPLDKIENNEENNYSFLYDEYKKMMNESLKKNLLFNKTKQIESQASSLASPSVSEQNKIRNLKATNSKIKTQIDSSQKDKKSAQQDAKDLNQSSSIQNDLRGRERTQNVKQKFQDLSLRLKRLLEQQIGGSVQFEQKSQSLSPEQQQQIANANQVLTGVQGTQSKKDSNKTGSQSLQNKNAFKINDENYATTNGFNTTSTTTQNAQFLPKAVESNVSVPVTSKNQSVIIKDNQGEQHFEEQEEEDEYNENGEYTDQDYYYIAVQFLNQQALMIQKVWRGYKTRKLIQLIRENMMELNSNWLQKQEKIEMNDFYNNNKDNDYGDNQDKVINISTIKSSIVSVNDQNEDIPKNSLPDVLANTLSPNKQIPSIVKEEESSQSRSPNNNVTYQDADFQKQSSQTSYHLDKQSRHSPNQIDSMIHKQTYGMTQSYQQDLLGLKELVIQKFSQFSSQLQNAQNLNTEESKQLLSQLQQLSEDYKNELLNSFQNSLETNQFYDSMQFQQNMVQNLKGQQDRNEANLGQSPSIQNINQNQFNNSKNEEVKFQSSEEIDNVLIKNNEDQYEDKSQDNLDGNHDVDHEQPHFEDDHDHPSKNDHAENEMLTQLLQNQTMKQELNQLYLLLTQEASKDKEKKYYLSSQAPGISSQNSHRNSYRMRMNTEENDKELKMQSSVDSNGQELVSSSLFDRDSFKLFTEKKLKELQKNENVEEIIRLREQAINLRHTTQVEYMNRMLRENAVSPRTYTTNKLELDNWAQKEQDELKETKQDFEKSLKRAIESISKTKQDYELTKKYKETLHHNDQGGSGPILEKKFLVDSNDQYEDEYEQVVDKKLQNLLPVNIQIQDNSLGENPLNSLNSGNDNENFSKFKEELKASALRDLGNSYYSSSEGLNSKSPLESLSNRNITNYKKNQKNVGQPTGQENDDNDDLVRVEDKSPVQGGSISDRIVTFENKQTINDLINIDDKQNPIHNNNTISNQDDNMVLLLTSTSKQNLQSSSESINSQGFFDQKNPKMKDQLWDTSPAHHNLDTSEYQQKNRERFTNEKMIIKKEDPFAHHGHPHGNIKKSPRFDTSSFSDSKDTNKDLSPKSDLTESNTEDDSLYQKKIHPIFPQSHAQNGNNTVQIQNGNAVNNQQLAITNLQEKNEEHSSYSPQIVVNEVFNSINEEIKEKWRMNAQVEERLNEQLNRLECVDKSDRYGIPSNLFVIEQYIISLFQYVKNYYKQEFVENINTPFGFSPQKRLKLIHGYDSFIESTSEQQLEEFSTLPFVLSEELFIEFEQNIIGNGEEEKDQIIKEFQHIHNKAIFDTFNESLNLFRPFFALGGSPYAWSKSEKNIIFCHATEQNLESILDKAKKKVIEWASFLCGIINEHENINKRALHSEEDSLSDDKLKSSQESDKSPLQSLLDNNNQPENEYFAQSREERLSRMLLVEIFENEYKWQLYEDEKAEVLMELSDLVFEELVEEIVDEIADSKY